jgi:hypothetical protein
MILGAPDIEGIRANGEEHRISQFADDTQLLLKNYESIRRAEIYIDKYQKATGMKVNLIKYEGIRCGSTRAMEIPQDLRYIKWLGHGEYTKRLGVPYWASGENDAFWDDLYIKIKPTIAAWSGTSQLTQQGRVILANFMIYSRPRYWIQTMLPPHHFQKQLSQDVHHLVWAKEHDFERSEKGSTTVAKPWIRKQAIHNPKRTKNHAPSLGLGL